MNRVPAAAALTALLAAASAAPSAPPSLVDVSQALVGTWQSTDDTKFTREFDAGGAEVERYEGDQSATNQGRWAVFLGSAPPPELKGQKFAADGVYLKLDQNGDQLLYVLVGLSRSDLKMIYLAQGRMLSFVRLR